MLLTFLHIIPSLFSAQDDLSVSDDMEKGVINSIKIEGVKGEGDYNLSTKEWSVSSSSSASYNVPISADGLTVGSKTVDLAPNATLMMIPQTLSGAKVTIKFTPTGKEDALDLTFKLENTHWDPGNHVTYLLSTTKIIKLNMGSVTYPKWQTAEGSAFTSEKLKSSYASGDAIGMYVVDKYNKVVKANVQLTTTDGNNWNFSSSQKFTGSLSYDYFLYYPYQAGGLAGAPKEGDAVFVKSGTNQISASDFFSGAIEEWSKSLKTDQGDDGKFNSCDLQIGKGEFEESSSTVAFPTMTHAMGLAEITLGAKTLETNYYLSDYPEYTWKNTTTFHAYAGISGYSLYKIADYRYVALVKPDITTDFSCGSTTDPDSWTDKVSVKPAANCVTKVIATSNRTSLSNIPYKMEVGDIYYSDGAMTHQSEDLASGKTPIGIVGYLGSDYWTEKDTKEKGIGGHALVMCLKTIGSTGSTVEAQEDYKIKRDDGDKVKAYIGTRYIWNSSNNNTGRPMVNSQSLLVNSYCNQHYGSGYTNTSALIHKCDSLAAAAYQAHKYNTLPANSSKCTGWFLPSAGQYYAVMQTLGAPFSDDWYIDGFFSNMTTVTKNINDKLKKVGDTKYTEFFGSINTWAWTSSEYTSSCTLDVDSGLDNARGSGSVRFAGYYYYGNKMQQKTVRPFLAF